MGEQISRADSAGAAGGALDGLIAGIEQALGGTIEGFASGAIDSLGGFISGFFTLGL